MAKKRFLNQVNTALVMAICVLPLFLSPEKMFGATLRLDSNTSVTDVVNFIDSDSETKDFVKAESLAAESLLSVNGVDFNTALLEDAPQESSSDSANVSLSLQSILESLSQLDLHRHSNPGEVTEVSVLPQVKASDVFKEVYDFTPKFSKNSSQPINAIVFRHKTFAPIGSLENFTQGKVSLSTPSIVLPSQGGALSLVGIPQITGNSLASTPSSGRFFGSLAQLTNPSKRSSQVDARFGVLPRLNFRTHLREVNSNLSAVAENLDNSYQLKIKTDFRLLPQTILATSLDLTDNGFHKSTLIRRDVDVASLRLQNLLKEDAQQYEQIVNQRQAQYQQQIQENLAEQKRRQQQIDAQTARRQQEQQSQLQNNIGRP